MKTPQYETYPDVDEGAADPRLRVWLSGVVVLDAPLDSRQGQPFANWARSCIRYSIGIGEAPPQDYTGIEYAICDPNPAQPAAPPAVPSEASEQ